MTVMLRPNDFVRIHDPKFVVVAERVKHKLSSLVFSPYFLFSYLFISIYLYKFTFRKHYFSAIFYSTLPDIGINRIYAVQ